MTYAYDKTDSPTDQFEHPGAPDADLTALHTHYVYDANGNRTQALPPRAYEHGSTPSTPRSATKWSTT